jgi:triose/dihydroxyacetone kinase / FAD-AMP lyase (cyclizing)
VINLLLTGESSTLNESMGKEWLMLINNMGGTTELEMSILAKGALEQMEKRGHTVHRIVMGPLITSLGMAGFSFSLLSVNQAGYADMIKWIDAPTDAPAWPKATQPATYTTLEANNGDQSKAAKTKELSEASHANWSRLLSCACTEL